jgi:hypothetical protein
MGTLGDALIAELKTNGEDLLARLDPQLISHPAAACPSASRDENGTEIFRTDRFRFLYYEPFFNMKNCQFQLISQLFSTIFYTL